MLANPRIGAIDSIGKKDCLTNLSGDLKAKENAVPSAKDNGVNSISKARNFQEPKYDKSPGSAIAKLIDPNHKKAARMLGFVLAADTPDCWWSLRTVLEARLTVKERASMALMALCLFPRRCGNDR